ncbi:peptidase S16 [Conexibacter sp. W3-3-2]|uniref:LON peptidase substrate-binding domain-containing protein n=1 Tax=Conexibacter sp. W3-3-2 TaxID=2675227 RepID=UPI0012B8921D|nr:LON peptidase substrate-binding domain-containing protein [Conexibacter sp. W3-3-2]MTD46805.1 peptidase S16 [Conexibacter sp. W3-3-2]
MPGDVQHQFPLFPLGMVALPNELVPLHIFEERYRTMIAQCLEGEGEFGIVWSGDDGLRTAGCAMRIEQVLERFDDGRVNILTRGTRVFELLERTADVPYPTGDVRFEEEEPEDADADAAAAAHEAYAELVREATEKELERDELDAMDAYEMAATVDFGLEAKQALLELRSENARLRLVTRLFRAATKRLDFIERAQVRAKSNGKVRFG